MIKDFEIIKQLVGKDVTEEELKYVDCYVRPQLGLFIPIAGPVRICRKERSYTSVIYDSDLF